MISIKELCDKYRIKQATAYKWRAYLQKSSMVESWENYDRINNREVNLSALPQNAAIVTTTPKQLEQVNQTQTTIAEPAPEVVADSGFGLSIGRLQELNSEAELEVLVKSKLKDYHESRLQSQRSQELKSKIAEVKKVDPKSLGGMLASLGMS